MALNSLIMNMARASLTSLLIIIYTINILGSDGFFLPPRDVSDSNCNRVYNWVKEESQNLQTKDPEDFERLEIAFRSIFEINITDTAAVKARMCKIVRCKTLKELSEQMPGISYEELEETYEMVQDAIAQEGGYTASLIYYNANKDFYDMFWESSEVVPGARKVSEVISLPKLTGIFEVMQVKYGSRWIASFYGSHGYGLVDDPQTFAEELYSSESFEDFKSKQTAISELGSAPLQILYDIILDSATDKERILQRLERDEQRATIYGILGDLGLLTLKY